MAGITAEALAAALAEPFVGSTNTERPSATSKKSNTNRKGSGGSSSASPSDVPSSARASSAAGSTSTRSPSVGSDRAGAPQVEEALQNHLRAASGWVDDGTRAIQGAAQAVRELSKTPTMCDVPLALGITTRVRYVFFS
jgi:hypothetical protein